MAMIAWSAKVWSRAICLSEKGPGCGLPTTIEPRGDPSRSMGTARTLRKPPTRDCCVMPYSGSSRMSGMCTTARVRTVRVAALCDPRRIGNAPLIAVIPSGSTFVVAARWTSSPSNLQTLQTTASHNRMACSAIASNTGWVSVGELAITFRISLVAVCCSNACFVSLNRRTFSMAMTA